MICLDANILLDVALERTHKTACESLIDTARKNREELAITALTLDIVMYYAERHRIDMGWIQQYLNLFTWLPVEEADAHWAFARFKGKDFEDGLQVACALREKCSKFVTIDRGLAKKYATLMQIELIR